MPFKYPAILGTRQITLSFVSYFVVLLGLSTYRYRQDLKLTPQSSEMWPRIVSYMDIDVSEEPSSYIFSSTMRKVEAAGPTRILVQSTRRHIPEVRRCPNTFQSIPSGRGRQTTARGSLLSGPPSDLAILWFDSPFLMASQQTGWQCSVHTVFGVFHSVAFASILMINKFV